MFFMGNILLKRVVLSCAIRTADELGVDSTIISSE